MYENKLIDLYSDGVKMSEIAAYIGCNEPEAREMIRAYKFASQGRFGKIITYTQEFKEVLTDRYVRGIRLSTIGRELGINNNKISEIINDSGFAVYSHEIDEINAK